MTESTYKEPKMIELTRIPEIIKKDKMDVNMIMNTTKTITFPRLNRTAKRVYGPSFGIVNLLAMGKEVKYFPDELLKDLNISHLDAKEIRSIFLNTGMDLDGDVIGDWWVDLMHHSFTKTVYEVSWNDYNRRIKND